MPKRVVYSFVVMMALFLSVLPGCDSDSSDQSEELQYQSVMAEEIRFEWAFSGDEIHIRLTAVTEGWVAVGFNPEIYMLEADFMIGYVLDGEAHVFDHYGAGPYEHLPDLKMGGTEDLRKFEGTESFGSTTVSFKRPVDTGDAYDAVLNEGDSVIVILAYGPEDNVRGYHSKRSSLRVEL